MDVAGAVKAAKAGQVEFRAEKAGIVHAGVGKASFTEDALAENIRAFVDAVIKAKPAGAKGTYMKKVSVSSTMGPGVQADMSTVSCVGLTAQTAGVRDASALRRSRRGRTASRRCCPRDLSETAGAVLGAYAERPA